MKTDIVYVNSEGKGMEEALLLSERVMGYRLDDNHKSLLHIRLLTEEMLCLMNALAGKIQALFWIESEGDTIHLHLKTNIQMYSSIRKELLSVSTKHSNLASTGVMGRIRDAIICLFEPEDEETAYMVQMGMMNIPDVESRANHFSNTFWSMNHYRLTVNEQKDEDEQSKQAWDELEKSVIANLADEVRISIEGNDIEMIVDKKV